MTAKAIFKYCHDNKFYMCMAFRFYLFMLAKKNSYQNIVDSVSQRDMKYFGHTCPSYSLRT